MGNMTRRLHALEEHARSSHEDFEQRIGREVLRRMSTPDLYALEAAMERAQEPAPGEFRFAEEDMPTIQRYEEMCKEVRDEYRPG